MKYYNEISAIEGKVKLLKIIKLNLDCGGEKTAGNNFLYHFIFDCFELVCCESAGLQETLKTPDPVEKLLLGAEESAAVSDQTQSPSKGHEQLDILLKNSALR